MFAGIKIDSVDSPPIKVRAPKWIRTSPTNYEYYDPRESGVVQWVSLKIHTRKCTDEELESKCGICKEKVEGKSKKCDHYYHDECLKALPKEIRTQDGCVYCVPL